MKVVHIVPELNEGGVERHVLRLANSQAERHDVVVVSAGGRLASRLAPEVRHIRLPVHSKNAITGVSCALRLAQAARRGSWSVMHAHSRVPAWIALAAHALCGVPLVVTAHARYSPGMGIYPLKRADGVIYISQAVRGYIEEYLGQSKHGRVIYNALPENVKSWTGSGKNRLLFLGRLTEKKGAGIVIEALARTGMRNWTLDVVGDGPMEQDLRILAERSGIADLINFCGHSDTPWEWIAACDLFLFPSLDEGMGLALSEAIASGVPLLASDIPATRELLGDSGSLIPPGDVSAWSRALANCLAGRAPPPCEMRLRLPDAAEMAKQTEEFYEDVLA